MPSKPILPDHDLWKVFTKDVVPMEKDERVVFKQGKLFPLAQQKQGNIPHSFVHPKIKKKPFDKNIYIDGHIDLHGMTETGAYMELCQFIKRMRTHKHKWGLVITGKSGILFEMTPKWLGAMVDEVPFFCPARPIHGGTGALYLKFR